MTDNSKHTLVETGFAVIFLIGAVGMFFWTLVDETAAKITAPFWIVLLLVGTLAAWNARLAFRIRQLESDGVHDTTEKSEDKSGNSQNP